MPCSRKEPRDAFEIGRARFHLGGGCVAAVDLAGDAFLHMQQVDFAWCSRAMAAAWVTASRSSSV